MTSNLSLNPEASPTAPARLLATFAMLVAVFVGVALLQQWLVHWQFYRSGCVFLMAYEAEMRILDRSSMDGEVRGWRAGASPSQMSFPVGPLGGQRLVSISHTHSTKRTSNDRPLM